MRMKNVSNVSNFTHFEAVFLCFSQSQNKDVFVKIAFYIGELSKNILIFLLHISRKRQANEHASAT